MCFVIKLVLPLLFLESAIGSADGVEGVSRRVSLADMCTSLCLLLCVVGFGLLHI